MCLQRSPFRIAGFWIAYVLDAATSAGMSVFYGLVFVAALASTRLRLLRVTQ